MTSSSEIISKASPASDKAIQDNFSLEEDKEKEEEEMFTSKEPEDEASMFPASRGKKPSQTETGEELRVNTHERLRAVD